MIGMPWTENTALTFFGVLVRISVLMTLMPLFGERNIPGAVRVLLGLALSVAVFPHLISSGWVRPADAEVWASSSAGIMGTVAKEALLGAVLGFVAKLVFEVVQVAGEVTGTLMGYATASQFDPMTESQSQLMSRFQMALAMLLFLSLDGHHVLVQSVVESFRWVSLGQAKLGGASLDHLVKLSGEVLRTGFEMASPMVLATFLVFVVYAVFAKAMPQVNLLVLSLSVSAAIGFVVLWVGSSHSQSALGDWLGRMGQELSLAIRGLS